MKTNSPSFLRKKKKRKTKNKKKNRSLFLALKHRCEWPFSKKTQRSNFPPTTTSPNKMALVRNRQDETQRRELFREGWKLNEELDRKAEDFKQRGDKTLFEQVRKSEAYYVKLREQKETETSLYREEATHIKKLSKIALDRTNDLRVSHNYTLDSFSKAICRLVGVDQRNEDWNIVAQRACEVFDRAPRIPTFLLGPATVNKEPRKRAERKTAERHTGPRVTAGDLKVEQYAEETETVKRIGEVKGLLEKKKKTNFFDFVVDPTSYTQTVENIFHFSFLIKEGMASLKSNNGEMEVEIRDKPETDEESVRHQCIITLDEEAWKSIAQTRMLEGRRPVIPHRDYSHLAEEQEMMARRGQSVVNGEEEEGGESEEEQDSEEEEIVDGGQKRKRGSEKQRTPPTTISPSSKRARREK